MLSRQFFCPQKILFRSSPLPFLRNSKFHVTAPHKMLEINDFRADKGGNPEKIRESQRRRHANVDLVDEVIALDQEWIKRRMKNGRTARDIYSSLPNGRAQ
jgi:hypothetical protein